MIRISLRAKRLFEFFSRVRRSKIYTHNPLSPPEKYEYIQFAPGYVKEALESYENWDGRAHVPPKLKDLLMVLRIEVSRRYKNEE